MEKGQRDSVIGCRAGVDHPCGLSIQEMLRKSHLDHWTEDQGLGGSRGEKNDQAFKAEMLQNLTNHGKDPKQLD